MLTGVSKGHLFFLCVKLSQDHGHIHILFCISHRSIVVRLLLHSDSSVSLYNIVINKR